MLTTNTDVLIVGAGPTGTALAIALQQAGVSHLLIDKLEQGQNTSRAAVIHAHTLEMLEELGVSEELAEARHEACQVRHPRPQSTLGAIAL